MTPQLEAYREVTPQGTVDLLLRLAERVRDRRGLHVSAGRFGGGVASTLERVARLMTEIGVETRWEVIGGDAAFFATAKALEGGLQG